MGVGTETLGLECSISKYVSGFTNTWIHEHSQCQGTLGGSWSAQDRLGIYISRQKNDDRPTSGEVQNMVEICNTSCGALRRLYAESHDIFMALHEKKRDPEEFIHFSRQYRTCLVQCSLELDTHNEEELLAFNDILKAGNAIWHLSEIMLLTSRWSIAPRLVLWVREHYHGAEFQQLLEEIKTWIVEGKEVDAMYWKSLYFLALTGNGTIGAQLLELHPQRMSMSMQSTFDAIENVLIHMPTPEHYLASSFVHYQREWREWHATCIELYTRNVDIRTNAELKTLMGILCADEAVLNSNTETWYELFAAQLLLGEPCTQYHRYETQMAKCVRACGGSNTELDNIVMSMLELNVVDVLHDLNSFNLKWLTAHFCDLMTLSGHIRSDILPEIECSLQEYFLNQYALDLYDIPGLWQMASRYLRSSPVFGPILLQTGVERIKPETDFLAHKLIDVCNDYRLDHVARSIQLVRAMEWKQNGDFGCSLFWLLQAREFTRIDKLCTEILDQYHETKNPRDLDVIIDTLGDDLPKQVQGMKVLSKLDFLRNYRELLMIMDDFNILMSHGDAENKLSQILVHAVQTIVKIFATENVPVKFWSDLIGFLFPFLELSPPVFQLSELQIILHRITQLEINYKQEKLPNELIEKCRVLMLQRIQQAILS